MTQNQDVIVIGGGASGLMAAGRAAEMGARVLLLEKMPRLGLKLGLTGKGRGNLTNQGDIQTFIQSYAPDGKFLRNCFARFFNQDLMDFFETLGVPLTVERGGRVFPVSNRALDLVSALLRYGQQGRVRISKEHPVEEIEVGDGAVKGVWSRGRFFEAQAVVLATGGASYPRTGSSGDGYRLARSLGHTIIPVRPYLIPLVTGEDWVSGLQGLSLKNVQATLYLKGVKDQSEFGEMIFTHFGLSGPIILTLSGRAVDWLPKGKVEVSLNLKPALTAEQIDLRLRREFQENPLKGAGSILKNLLPSGLIPVFLSRANVPADKKSNQITSRERERIKNLLSDFRLTVQGHRPLEEAIVTAGGIALKEVDPRTLESRKIKNLFLCGEVLDIQGQTGGFNLQAAFSTGWVAGTQAAQGIRA
jgi:predicted Rossmann fold flavoprotein